MDLNEIRELTLEYGGGWELNHVNRLLKLIEIIGEDQVYDSQLVWIAAHLHDWGAFEQYKEAGKDHAIRSHEVAAGIVEQLNLNEKRQNIILNAISEHNLPSGKCSSIESTLLRDADNLDFLGFIGIARDFAKGPRDLKKCLEATKKRIKFFNYLTLPRSIEIGKERLEEINFFIARVESESFSFY
ncbi:MAG: HD domain-containing protein [Bacteroidota bacterium]